MAIPMDPAAGAAIAQNPMALAQAAAQAGIAPPTGGGFAEKLAGLLQPQGGVRAPQAPATPNFPIPGAPAVPQGQGAIQPGSALLEMILKGNPVAATMPQPGNLGALLGR